MEVNLTYVMETDMKDINLERYRGDCGYFNEVTHDKKPDDELVYRKWKLIFDPSMCNSCYWSLQKIMIDYNLYLKGYVLLDTDLTAISFDIGGTDGWFTEPCYYARYVTAQRRNIDTLKKIINGICPDGLVRVEEVS